MVLGVSKIKILKRVNVREGLREMYMESFVGN